MKPREAGLSESTADIVHKAPRAVMKRLPRPMQPELPVFAHLFLFQSLHGADRDCQFECVVLRKLAGEKLFDRAIESIGLAFHLHLVWKWFDACMFKSE